MFVFININSGDAGRQKSRISLFVCFRSCFAGVVFFISYFSSCDFHVWEIMSNEAVGRAVYRQRVGYLGGYPKKRHGSLPLVH